MHVQVCVVGPMIPWISNRLSRGKCATPDQAELFRADEVRNGLAQATGQVRIEKPTSWALNDTARAYLAEHSFLFAFC